MTKRRAAVNLAACALTALAVEVYFFLPSGSSVNSRVTAAAFQQIQQGMRRQLVEEILDGPPDREGHFDFCFHRKYAGRNVESAEEPKPNMGYWYGPDVQVWVLFDKDGNVCIKSLSPNPSRQPSLWERVLAWFP